MSSTVGNHHDVSQRSAPEARDEEAGLELTLEVREIGERLSPEGHDPAVYSSTAVGRERLRHMLWQHQSASGVFDGPGPD